MIQNCCLRIIIPSLSMNSKDECADWGLYLQIIQIIYIETISKPNITRFYVRIRPAYILSTLANDATDGLLGHHDLCAQVNLVMHRQPELILHLLKDVELGL